MEFDQRKQISSIVQGRNNVGKTPVISKCSGKVEESTKKYGEFARESVKGCETSCSCGKVNASNVTDIVAELLKQMSKKGKTVIKIEIEVQNE